MLMLMFNACILAHCCIGQDMSQSIPSDYSLRAFEKLISEQHSQRVHWLCWQDFLYFKST